MSLIKPSNMYLLNCEEIVQDYIRGLEAELAEVRQSAATIASENACKMVEIKKLEGQLRVKDEALRLVDEVWTRNQVHPDVNFMGDDEHEAWNKVKSALMGEK